MFKSLANGNPSAYLSTNVSAVILQVEGLEGVTVSSNSTSEGDSCDWFVTFTGTPGNQDQVCL